jgi:hypothetical protein
MSVFMAKCIQLDTSGQEEPRAGPFRLKLLTAIRMAGPLSTLTCRSKAWPATSFVRFLVAKPYPVAIVAAALDFDLFREW